MSDTNTSPASTGAQRVLEMLASIVIHVAVIALLGLVVVQGWQVFARYVINDSPSWTEPVTLLLLSTGQALRWNIALAAALVVGAAVWGSRPARA